MAAPLLFRGLPLLRLRFCYQRLQHPTFVLLAPRLFSAASESSQPYDDAASDGEQTTAVLRTKDPPKYPRWPDPDYRKWKEREAQILKDIEPVIFLAKEIIHSDRSAIFFNLQLPGILFILRVNLMSYHFYTTFTTSGISILYKLLFNF